jgi:hypothetical protein
MISQSQKTLVGSGGLDTVAVGEDVDTAVPCKQHYQHKIPSWCFCWEKRELQIGSFTIQHTKEMMVLFCIFVLPVGGNVVVCAPHSILGDLAKQGRSGCLTWFVDSWGVSLKIYIIFGYIC